MLLVCSACWTGLVAGLGCMQWDAGESGASHLMQSVAQQRPPDSATLRSPHPSRCFPQHYVRSNGGLKVGEALRSYFGAIPDNFKWVGWCVLRCAALCYAVLCCAAMRYALRLPSAAGPASPTAHPKALPANTQHTDSVTGLQSGLYSLLTPVLALAGASYLFAPGMTLSQVFG